MKQTAVEWLANELLRDHSILTNHDAIEKAKEMETQQQGYSEEEVCNLLYRFLEHIGEKQKRTILNVVPNEWFEQFKKK
jgi:uncharacterized membrane-anchored protein